jgi:hypothetical protein
MPDPIDPFDLGSSTPADVVAALGRARTSSGDQDEQEPPIGTGQALDGRVRVRAVLPGRIENLEPAPSLLRLEDYWRFLVAQPERPAVREHRPDLPEWQADLHWWEEKWGRAHPYRGRLF